MWKLLQGQLLSKEDTEVCGLVPRDAPIELQNKLPSELGIGLTDIACIPGSDAAAISRSTMERWIPHFYGRLKSHVSRVKNSGHEHSDNYVGPTLIAFTGKRQFSMLYPASREPKNVPFGLLPDSIPLPPGWPFPRDKSKIWILPSSSGRAAMSHEQRVAPYQALAQEYMKIRRLKVPKA
jgi:hypothetical protein